MAFFQKYIEMFYALMVIATSVETETTCSLDSFMMIISQHSFQLLDVKEVGMSKVS